MTANEIIRNLNLLPHPEGGYYKETYRSAETHRKPGGDERNISTAIYFLLENGDKSHFHRIKSDEMWFFHQGEPLEIVSIQNGGLVSVTLGNDLARGEVPQAMVPANTWFGSRVKSGKGYALVSCTVSPGFDFNDFQMADREELIMEFSGLVAIISEFTI
ncbi:cupin domain-containing protein [Daejeonella lutea]|uniref:DUF985 domain-containing protein n=1 Tax=Daejeonella lutea TaxID=572036 RepID=A0A1T5A3Y0_9SPHI|nr:cupin domain-containing protein [Daejeonella lutea]SKB29595.1 hypothetical protein SAMN05661099_0285 [Daejeonella lutea]